MISRIYECEACGLRGGVLAWLGTRVGYRAAVRGTFPHRHRWRKIAEVATSSATSFDMRRRGR